MDRVISGPRIEICSGVWNTSDVTSIISVVALGAIALTVGVLGIFGHQGLSLSSCKAISSAFPKACCALVSGVGGSLLLTGGITVILKIIADRKYKHFPVRKEEFKLGEKEYEVFFDSWSTIPTYCKLFTRDEIFVFISFVDCIAKVRELEKLGYTNREEVVEVSPSDPIALPEESKKGHPRFYLLGCVVTLISLPAFIVPFCCPFPYAWTVQTAALGVLTAVAYGIVNDQFAIRQSKHYFTLGHTPFHKRLLKTDNATANGVIWGIHATWVLGAVAGVVLAIAATITRAYAINPLYLTPFTIMGSLIVHVNAHMKSKNRENALQHPILKGRVNQYFNEGEISPDSRDYDRIYLRNVPEAERAGWLGVGKRSEVGYSAMPTLGGVLLVAIIAARVLLAVG